jgi:hypothetical protein
MRKLSFLFFLLILSSLILGLFQIASVNAMSPQERLCPEPTISCNIVTQPCKGQGVCVCSLFLFCVVNENNI